MSTPQWLFEPFRLDPANACLWRGETAVALPPKAFDVLRYLVTHPDRLVTKDELLDAVWPATAISDAVVRVAIGVLRKALGDTAQTPRYIATVARRGYRFVAPVTCAALMAAAPPGPSPPLPLSASPPPPAPPLVPSRTALEGERKQVTVLFADIADSLALIQHLDPEAAQQLLDPALHRMMDAVRRYGGTVNQVLGDGIMALFGAPIAYEDHALRACYAALAMQAARRDAAEEGHGAHDVALQMRVGLNSGEVVVRTLHHDLQAAYSAVGQATHLAARMEQVAAPGTVVLTAATLRLVEGLVRVKALGPALVKGLGEPLDVYELLSASALQGRFQAVVARGLTRFVGRESALASVRQALERAVAGQGQVVAVVGEAGMGKSRLVYEGLQTRDTPGWQVLASAALSYTQATPYFPVVTLLKRYFHVEDGETPQAIQASITAQVRGLDVRLQETVPALLALLDALPDDSPFRQLDPAQRRSRILEALKRLLVRASQTQPVVLVVEDLHWLDTETQAWLDRLIDSLPAVPLVLLVNYRPEYQHGWGSKTYYTQLRLDPLPPASTTALVQEFLGDDASLAPLIPLLIAHTQGNPFFLEESLRTLVETQALVGTRGAYRLVQALPTVQVPATVQAVLAARIDRLPPEDKRLLHTAAVVGTEVPFSVVQAIAELPEVALHRGLAHLQAAEFLYETHLFPEPAYTFKHALTHEVAYNSLLLERRRVLHARLVEALEALAAERGAEQVERLAHHALRGEVWAKALAYCRQAGEKALAQSAHREAVGYCEQALRALPHLPETRDTREQAIDLRLALRVALYPSGDRGDILEALCEAERLAAALDDSRRLGQVSAFLSDHFYNMSAYDQSITTAHRALALATASADVVMQALAHHALVRAYHAQGDYRRAIDCHRHTVAPFEGARRHERFGCFFLPAVSARVWLAACHAELGTFAAGRALGEEGLRIAEAVAHPASLMWAYYGVGLPSLRQGDLSRALALLERAMGLCHEADLPFFFPGTAAALGTAYVLDGRVTDAVRLLTQTMEQSTATESAYYETFYSLSLGEAQMLAGRREEAHARAERTLALARAHQERGNQAYALRLLGDLAARHEPPAIAQAEAHYQQALALAEALGMRPLQAHCHRSLGTLYATTGQWEQARAELSTAMEMYRGMEMTFWLPETEAVLAQVDA